MKHSGPAGIQSTIRPEFDALANPMSPLPLQLVLLFAVAYSQIFGGVSCCCLSHAFLAGWTNSSEINSPAGREVSAARPAYTPKCPRCAAARASSSRGTPEAKVSRAGVISDDNQCRCEKFAAIAGVETEPFSLKCELHELAPPNDVRNVVTTSAASVSRSYGVPMRFGGRSWQSVACVWNN